MGILTGQGHVTQVCSGYLNSHQVAEIWAWNDGRTAKDQDYPGKVKSQTQNALEKCPKVTYRRPEPP